MKENENWKEELLMSLLECGYKDLERLNEILKIARKFNITIDDILNNAEIVYEENIKFNEIIDVAMRLILFEISTNVEDEELAEKIKEHEILVNYFDSWFNIEALDNIDVELLEKISKEELIKDVVNEISSRSDKEKEDE
jgi:DNA-binding XRE family transcriptional regulator